MHNFLAKSAILALLAAGFAFTGDATRLVSRGKGILDKTTIPLAAPAEPPPSATATAACAPATVPRSPAGEAPHAPVAPSDSAPPPGPAEQVAVTPPTQPADAPVGRPEMTQTPPGGGPETLAIGGLSAGDRVMVWIGKQTGRARAMTVAFDIVDPATGDAIEIRHASGEEDESTLAPCRRVRLAGSVRPGLFGAAAIDAGRIVRRQSLCLVPTDRQGEAGARETIGPVSAIALVRAAPPAP